MFGPLPPLYKILVALAATAFFVGVGLWVNQVVAVTLPGRGVLVGVALGSVASYVLLHDFSHRQRGGSAPTGGPR